MKTLDTEGPTAAGLSVRVQSKAFGSTFGLGLGLEAFVLLLRMKAHLVGDSNNLKGHRGVRHHVRPKAVLRVGESPMGPMGRRIDDRVPRGRFPIRVRRKADLVESHVDLDHGNT